jgi:coenzyme F420 biosynthesis associated uncharacterized protein
MHPLPQIDWEVAASVGRWVVPPGPALPPREVREVVAGLRLAAEQATDRVRDVSLLPIAAPAEVIVVDRASWIRSTTAMTSAMLADVTEDRPPTLGDRVNGRFLGAQAGLMLAWVATRILGQFDPFGSPNRLLLVAPNIVVAERAMRVAPADFRLWVCLHEETHRFQFGRAPWLRGHLLGLIGELLADEAPAVAGWRPGGQRAGVADLLTTPAQRHALERVTAVMSVMEGHADVIMDLAGKGLIASVELLRSRMEQRRDRPGVQAVLQKLLGLSIKREQYREGAAFCRTVIARGGIEGLNRVFESPGLLPDLDELRAPHQWWRRVGS